ncbi:MAG: 50S ribosomal protein L25/general stress protein Ctc [Nocardioides sp.]|nr:50S ribosomal protein L25/general stress protein Ctc [Nocardioides sp.]
MAADKIIAETRTEFGKGAARRIRREDKVPAVIYGHGKEPIHVALPGHDTWLALKSGGANALLDLSVDGKDQLALTKDVQIDALKRTLTHIDFVAVRKGEKVHVEVPVHLVGEAAKETLVVTENQTLYVEAEATHIPEYFEISIEGLEAGTQILANEVELVAGSTLLSEEDLLMVNITEAPTAEEVEAELEEAEAEAGIEKDESEDEVPEVGDEEKKSDEEGSSEE